MSDNKDHQELKQALQQLTEALHTFCDAINTLRNACEGTLNNLSKSTSEKSDDQEMQRHERSLERGDSEKTETHYREQNQEAPNKILNLGKDYVNTQRARKKIAHRKDATSNPKAENQKGPEQPITQVGPEDMIQHVSQEKQLVVEVIEVFNEVNETRELHDEEEERFVEIIEEDDEQDTGNQSSPRREKEQPN
ncbi:unnamed protein product [Cylicocyclus nassatus]|uniref:Uncharacterized protein n=1 Tax=Cylicocyclus nassatus TaxID=53992 RepID=A0AA36GP18_CYLNA|nr:unnamed protein product [Cylicocyclus nassatus]